MRWRAPLAAGLIAGGLLAALLAPAATSAQVFGPPMTIFGSVTDSAGEIPADLPVEAYVGDTVCGRGKTQYTGDGAGRVAVYFADVVSREQTAGCGSDGAEVRIRIGDRFAAQTARWRPGPAQLDIVFGGATPRAIPTFTPTPRPTGAATSTPGNLTPTPAGGTTTPTALASASPSPSATLTSTATATATLRGGLSVGPSTGPSGDSGDDGGGFPVWAIVAIALGGLAVVGGGAGWALARRRRDDDDIVELGGN